MPRVLLPTPAAPAARPPAAPRHAAAALAALALLSCLATPRAARAQEQVLLAEVMPELAGSELAEVVVAPAPALGATLVVRSSDVRRALSREGHSAEGLAIPKAKRISRKRVQLSGRELLDAERDALADAASPCAVLDVQGPKQLSVTEGPRTTRVELANGRRTGRVSGSIVVQTGARQLRVPLMLKLSCPEPEVTSGKQVALIVQVGAVRISTLGEARQPGRTGDIIRVTNRATGASLRGRVIDARTLEVVP